MESKKKSKELFKKFRQIPPCSPYTGVDDGEAKQCALIAVDEIIKALNDDIYIQGETDIDSHIEYWKEVKQEIENI